jgi:hypothetical protein
VLLLLSTAAWAKPKSVYIAALSEAKAIDTFRNHDECRGLGLTTMPTSATHYLRIERVARYRWTVSRIENALESDFGRVIGSGKALTLKGMLTEACKVIKADSGR